MEIPEYLRKRADDYIKQRLAFVEYDKDCVKYWSKVRDTFIEFYSIGATEQMKIDAEEKKIILERSKANAIAIAEDTKEAYIGKALKVYEELMTCSGYYPEAITAELARMRNKLED